MPVVQCYVAKGVDVSDLNKGDRVTAKGRVDGLVMNVQMKECEIKE